MLLGQVMVLGTYKQKCVISKQVARLFGGFWVLGLFGQTEDKTIAKNIEKFIYVFYTFKKMRY